MRCMFAESPVSGESAFLPVDVSAVPWVDRKVREGESGAIHLG